MTIDTKKFSFDDFNQNPSIMICGNSFSGKTSVAKYLIDHFMNKTSGGIIISNDYECESYRKYYENCGNMTFHDNCSPELLRQIIHEQQKKYRESEKKYGYEWNFSNAKEYSIFLLLDINNVSINKEKFFYLTTLLYNSKRLGVIFIYTSNVCKTNFDECLNYKIFLRNNEICSEYYSRRVLEHKMYSKVFLDDIIANYNYTVDKNEMVTIVNERMSQVHVFELKHKYVV